MRAASLDLDLEVFQGPFDLLLTLVLKDEVDLLETDLAEVVLAYVAHLEAAGELDLEAATEFLVLIASLLELKSRLMLPQEEVAVEEPAPAEAVEELLARMLEYRRHRTAAGFLRERLEAEAGFRYREAAPPAHLRLVALDAARATYAPSLLAGAIEGLLRTPEPIDIGHVAAPLVSVDARLAHLRGLLGARRRFAWEDAVSGADRVTEAVTLFALLELYKAGEADWHQEEPFGPITVEAAIRGRPVRGRAVPGPGAGPGGR